MAVPRRSAGTLLASLNPAAVFAVVSLLFGTLMIAATPPLRGPDETAHFVRAYGIAQGDIVPSMTDAEGRKGVMMPTRMFAGFDHFERARVSEKKADFSWGKVFAGYFSVETVGGGAATAPEAFVRYEGSEGYSPVAYLPQTVTALFAKAAGLDFLTTFYLMRLAGLIAMTAIVAFAISLAGPLGWAFFAIGALPAALYGRAVINADGPALAFAMLSAALFLRPLRDAGLLARSGVLVLSALGKPANLAFILLEMLRPMTGRWPRHALPVALVVLPAIAAALTWTALGGDDAAAWRLAELTGTDEREFDPAWKLGYMLANPTAFPAAFLGWATSKDMGEFARQIVGVLGLFDTVLRPWVYPLVALLTAIPFVVPTGLPRNERLRFAAGAIVTSLAYVFTVFLIFYLVWTPVGADAVWGVQGRYLVPVLPLVAIATAMLINRAVDLRVTSLAAISAAVISGAASVEAILRTDWNF